METETAASSASSVAVFVTAPALARLLSTSLRVPGFELRFCSAVSEGAGCGLWLTDSAGCSKIPAGAAKLVLVTPQEGAADIPPPERILLPVMLGDLADRIAARAQQGGEPLRFGPYFLEPRDLVLRTGTRDEIRLTEKERDILLCLIAARPGTVERRDLLDSVWGYAEGVETHTLETHIYRLRQKIEMDPAKPQYLLTEGTGYRLID